MSPTHIISRTACENPPKSAVIYKTKRKINSRKAASIKYADFLERNGSKAEKVERVRNSGNYVELVADRAEEHTKVFSAFLSGDRFDPMTAHSISTKRALRLQACVDWIVRGEHLEFVNPKAILKAETFEAEQPSLWDKPKVVKLPSTDEQAEVKAVRYRILFVTLTVPNCGASDLAALHVQLSAARRRLLHDYRPLRKWVRGYVSTEEVTYNSTAGTYHPHLHMLLAVPEDYFKDGKPAVQTSELAEWWAKATEAKPNESRIVDMRAMHKNSVKDVMELTKYVTKTAELIEYGDEVMQTVMDAYKGQKQASCAGLFREAFTLYEAGELAEYLGEAEQAVEWATKRAGIWGAGAYSWGEPVELSAVEAYKATDAAMYAAGQLTCDTPEADKVIEPCEVVPSAAAGERVS